MVGYTNINRYFNKPIPVETKDTNDYPCQNCSINAKCLSCDVYAKACKNYAKEKELDNK